MISNVSFLGVIPPYKTKKAEIYPLEKDISAKDINKIVRKACCKWYIIITLDNKLPQKPKVYYNK